MEFGLRPVQLSLLHSIYPCFTRCYLGRRTFRRTSRRTSPDYSPDVPLGCALYPQKCVAFPRFCALSPVSGWVFPFENVIRTVGTSFPTLSEAKDKNAETFFLTLIHPSYTLNPYGRHMPKKKIRFSSDDLLKALVVFRRAMKWDATVYTYKKEVVKGKTKVVPVNAMLGRRQLYTVKELSHALDVSVRHIMRLIAESEFPNSTVVAVKKGIDLRRGQIVFTEDEYSYWFDHTLDIGLSDIATISNRKEKHHGPKNKGRPHSRPTR